LEEGLMTTCLFPRFSALDMVLRQSASTDIRVICKRNTALNKILTKHTGRRSTAMPLPNNFPSLTPSLTHSFIHTTRNTD
jgi:hypothetical protein